MIEKSITVHTYVDKICNKEPEKGDILLLTGVGDIFPFMRIHIRTDKIELRQIVQKSLDRLKSKTISIVVEMHIFSSLMKNRISHATLQILLLIPLRL